MHTGLRINLIALMMSSAALAAPPKSKSPAQPDPLLAQTKLALAKGDLSQINSGVERQILELIKKLDMLDKDHLVRLAAVRELARITRNGSDLAESHKTLLQWLVAHPRLFTILMLAMDVSDQPQRVLAVLDALHADQGEKLDQFPDLVAAICVVWDDPPPGGTRKETSVASDRAVPLLRYYINARDRLRYDPAALPWQLAVFVVHNTANSDDIQWALQRYASRGNVGGAFFDVPYDYENFEGFADRKVHDNDYTLQNLVHRGGVCADQAYFAVMVARSIGNPAVLCIGIGAQSDVMHAWVGYLQTQGHTVSWNFTEGRYSEFQNCRSESIDPQTGQVITDADVSLLGELQDISPEDRLASLALCKVADLAQPADRPAIYGKAINLCPGNRRAWVQFADLAATQQLSDAQREQLKRIVTQAVLKKYPDFACDVLVRADSELPLPQRLVSLDKTRGLFNTRPDLQANLSLTKGDALRDAKRTGEAIAQYAMVLDQFGYSGPIVLETMAHLGPVLRESHQLPRLAAMYKIVWARIAQPEIRGYIASTPYYRIGKQYQAVLEQIDPNGQELARVRAKFTALDASGSSRKSLR